MTPVKEVTSLTKLLVVCGYSWNDNQHCFKHRAHQFSGIEISLTEAYQVAHSDFTPLKKRFMFSKSASKLISTLLSSRIKSIGQEFPNDVEDITEILEIYGDGFPIYTFLIMDEKLHSLNYSIKLLIQWFVWFNLILAGAGLQVGDLPIYLIFAFILNLWLLVSWLRIKTEMKNLVSRILNLDREEIVSRLSYDSVWFQEWRY